MYVAVSYYNSFFNPKSYDDPVYYYQDIYTKQVATGLVYDTYIRLSKDEFISDNGWILESNQKSNAIKVESMKEDTYPPYFERLIRIIFEVSKKKESVSRSYMKVQELFAKVGGLFNACNIIFNLILYDYILFKFRVNYLNPAMGELRIKNFSGDQVNDKESSDSNQLKVKALNLKNMNNDNVQKNNASKDLENSQSKLNVNPNNDNKKIPYSSENNSSELNINPPKIYDKNEAPRTNFNNNYIVNKSVFSKTQEFKVKSNSNFYDNDLINEITNLSYLEVLFSRICCNSKKSNLLSKMETKEILKKFALNEYLILFNKVEILSESFCIKNS
jgi:hypothetical protein